MVNPTPGPEQYPPQGGPQGQPAWNAPQGPQGYGGAPQPGYGGQGYPGGPGASGGQRPTEVSTAAIIGIVIGGLGSFAGLFVILGVGLLFAISPVLGLFALLAIAAAVVVLIGGIFVLTGKPPKLLLLGSYASIAVQLLSLIISVAVGNGFSFLSLLGFILPGVIVFLLMQPKSKQYFASRGQGY